LPLSTDQPLPGLPSWVPDFSLKAPFLAHTGDLTWYYLYQVNSIHRGSKPFLRLHHGRHVVKRDPVEVTVEGRRLLSKGILVDEIEATVTSRIFSDTEEFKKHMAKVHDQQASSADESERKAAEQGRSIMQHLDNALDGDLTEDAFIDPETALKTMVALKLERTIQRGTLKEVDQICRANSTRLGRDVNPDRWMTNIWRDLFEGYRELENITEEKFLAEFHYLVGGTAPVPQQEWIEKLYTGTTSEDLSGHGSRYPVNDALRTLFSNHKRFFTTKYSGFYGIGLPKIEVGDKLVLLFPPVYMAFILRPLGDEYQMVGPAIVPLILRTKFLWDKATLQRDLDSFVIV
jgi:hypothetical protein